MNGSSYLITGAIPAIYFIAIHEYILSITRGAHINHWKRLCITSKTMTDTMLWKSRGRCPAESLIRIKPFKYLSKTVSLYYYAWSLNPSRHIQPRFCDIEVFLLNLNPNEVAAKTPARVVRLPMQFSSTASPSLICVAMEYSHAVSGRDDFPACPRKTSAHHADICLYMYCQMWWKCTHRE